MKPARPSQPLYVARKTYRLRRLMDAARLLPVLGLVLILLPLMRVPGQSGQLEVASEAVYLFAVWLVLVLAAVALSHALGQRRDDKVTPELPARSPSARGPAAKSVPTIPPIGAPSTTPAPQGAAKVPDRTAATTPHLPGGATGADDTGKGG